MYRRYSSGSTGPFSTCCHFLKIPTRQVCNLDSCFIFGTSSFWVVLPRNSAAVGRPVRKSHPRRPLRPRHSPEKNRSNGAKSLVFVDKDTTTLCDGEILCQSCEAIGQTEGGSEQLLKQGGWPSFPRTENSLASIPHNTKGAPSFAVFAKGGIRGSIPVTPDSCFVSLRARTRAPARNSFFGSLFKRSTP